MSSRQYVTIVPPTAEPGQLLPSQGTKVILPDGTELEGVTKVEMVASLNDVWRAVIHLHAHMAVAQGVEATFVAVPEETGDVTDLASSERRFRHPSP